MAQLHPQRLVAGLAATRRSMGDGTIRGRARLATPYRRVPPTVQDVVDMTDPAWPAEPCNCCPDPWAWYHGDDLDYYSEGDTVRVWPDRSGNGRDLTDFVQPGAAGFPKYSANVFGGQPGIYRDDTVDQDLRAQFTDVELPAVTFLLISQTPDRGAVGVHMLPTNSSHFSGEMYELNSTQVSGYAYAYLADGYIEGTDAATAQQPRLLATVGSPTPKIYVNGSELTPSFVEDVTQPVHTERIVLELDRQLSATTNAKVAEVKIWAEALSPDCIAAEWAAAQARYGL